MSVLEYPFLPLCCSHEQSADLSTEVQNSPIKVFPFSLYHKSAEKTNSLPKFCACPFSVKNNREKNVGIIILYHSFEDS